MSRNISRIWPSSARQTLEQAQNAREDSLLSAQRNLEDAQTALTQAESDYTQAQSSAALTAQSNAAQEQQLQLEIASTEKCIALFTACMETDGLICAERDTQLLTCDLKEGQPCPESGGLRIAREDSELVAAFSLPAAQAENLAAGQSVTIVQGSARTEATVRTAVEDTESGAFQVTAVLPEDAAGFRAGTAQAELIFPAPPMAPACPYLPSGRIRRAASFSPWKKTGAPLESATRPGGFPLPYWKWAATDSTPPWRAPSAAA
ncbi:efflux RND transporter periplasmic adaptor subunit [Allofournierella massiliensis]|uniref:hypothetical protein n=1 Tax=Allofournierella massiliensis TaxID=1650663 RepID=UPI00073E6DDB|nr:hypothetical protein [Fournierella massiliensis]